MREGEGLTRHNRALSSATYASKMFDASFWSLRRCITSAAESSSSWEWEWELSTLWAWAWARNPTPLPGSRSTNAGEPGNGQSEQSAEDMMLVFNLFDILGTRLSFRRAGAGAGAGANRLFYLLFHSVRVVDEAASKTTKAKAATYPKIMLRRVHPLRRWPRRKAIARPRQRPPVAVVDRNVKKAFVLVHHRFWLFVSETSSSCLVSVE